MSDLDVNSGSMHGPSAVQRRGHDPHAPANNQQPISAMRYEAVELSGGGSARVLTECCSMALVGPDETGGVNKTFPATQDWRPLLERLINEPSSLADYALLKYSDTGEVFRATLAWAGGSLSIVAKQSRTRGWLGRAAGRARSYLAPNTQRARRSFRRAQRLLKGNIRTAIPIALIERCGAGGEAWLVSEYVDGLVDLDHLVFSLLSRVERQRQRTVRNQLIDVVVALLVRLEQSGWYHRDLKASNILLTNWDAASAKPRPSGCAILPKPREVAQGKVGIAHPTACGSGAFRLPAGAPAASCPEVWLLDLDGLRRRRPWERVPDKRSLVRLVASLFDYRAVTRTDCVRFLQRYLVMSCGSDLNWKAVFHDVANRARAYHQESASRRITKQGGFGG